MGCFHSVQGTGGAPTKCTARLDDLCPSTIDASLAVWAIADFTKPRPKHPRFALAEPAKDDVEINVVGSPTALTLPATLRLTPEDFTRSHTDHPGHN